MRMARSGYTGETIAFIGAVACLISGCNHQHGQNNGSAPTEGASTPPAPSQSIDLPTRADAERAVAQAINLFDRPIIKTGAVGAPTDCAQGVANGQSLTVCKVCADIMEFQPSVTYLDDISPERVTFPIPFKRAISYDTPDIAPAVGNPGVWVPSFFPTVPGGPPSISYTIGAKSVLMTTSQGLPPGLFFRENNGKTEIQSYPYVFAPGLIYQHLSEPGTKYRDIFMQADMPTIFHDITC